MPPIIENNLEAITLSIYIPCFNEENEITNVLNNIKEGIQNINYEVLITDDASTDKTLESIEKFKKNNPNINIKIFSNEINKGIGFNFWETANKAQGKYYMIIHGDDPIPSIEIKKLVSNISKADMVLAYFKHDNRKFTRRLVSKSFVTVINLISSNNIKYYNSDNIYLLENVKSFNSFNKGGAGFAYQAELITYLRRQNKTYIEVEVDLPFETPKDRSEVSQGIKLHNLISVAGGVISIFLKQIIYILKKLLFWKKRDKNF